MSNQQISRRELLWVTLACLGYFLILLGSRVLNVPDEGRYSEVARAMLLSGDFITPKLNGIAFFHKPVFHYWLQSASFSVFGITEWSARLMPALAGVLGCVLTYIAGTLLYGRRTGRLAVLMLATNPLYFLSSRYADMNLEVAVFITCALLCFMIAMQYPLGSKRRNILWAAYAFAALAVLTKGLIGIVFPMMVVGVWVLVTQQWRLLREMYLASGLLIFLALVLPWFIAVQVQNPGFFDYFFVYQHITRFTSSGFNNPLPFWFYLPLLLVGFFPWSVAFLFGIKESVGRIWSRSLTSQTDLFLWLWLLLILGFFSLPESKIVGYILPVLPAMALLSAASLASRLETLSKTRGYVYAFFGVALVALLIGLAMLLPMGNLPHQQAIAEIKPYILAALVAGGVVTIVPTLFRKAGLALAAAALTGALFSFSLLALVTPVSSADSIKPLALLVKDQLRPGDMVVTYEDYYYDLGIYLDWPEHIVVISDWQDEDIPKIDNWRSEFYHGFPDTEGEEAWMLNQQAFATRFASMDKDKSVYLFCVERSAPQLESMFALQMIGKQNGIVLLSNHSLRNQSTDKITTQ